MAAIQPFVNLQPFKGTEKENTNEFLRQLASCIQIAGIANNDRHQYLHLHLKGGALTFFGQLPEATRVDYDLAVAALRERYQNDQRVQLQKLIFSARKLKSSEEGAQGLPHRPPSFGIGGIPQCRCQSRCRRTTRSCC